MNATAEEGLIRTWGWRHFAHHPWPWKRVRFRFVEAALSFGNYPTSGTAIPEFWCTKLTVVT